MKEGRFDKKPQVKIDMATPKISFKKFTQGSIPEIKCEMDKFEDIENTNPLELNNDDKKMA